jgi:hypothetical protein
MLSPERQLASFIAKFTPELARQATEILAKVRGLVPGAIELVYDNYNALAIGFGSTEKMTGIVFSIALYPRWVSMFFMGGPNLPDPHGLLQGEGSMVRHVVLDAGAATLDRPAVRALLAAALHLGAIAPAAPSRIVIKSISPKQRSRRPEAKAAKVGRAAKPVARTVAKAKAATKAKAAAKATAAKAKARR